MGRMYGQMTRAFEECKCAALSGNPICLRRSIVWDFIRYLCKEQEKIVITLDCGTEFVTVSVKAK